MLELVIALAIGVVVTSAAISLYRIQRDAFDTINEQARLADAAASALAVLGAHIRLAGYRGTKSGVAPFSAGSARRANAGMASLGQSTGAAAALFGCHAGRPVGPLGAERCERIDGQSDGLQVRYRADTIATWRSSDGRATDCLGQGITVTAEKTEPWVVNRFFARYSPSSGKPELYCEGSGRLGVAQPLVEGIERLQLSYWIAGARAPLDSTKFSGNEWEKVIAVEVCVVVRGEQHSARRAFSDCNGRSAQNPDGYPRIAVRATYAVRNAASTESVQKL